jgi:FecR-like protein
VIERERETDLTPELRRAVDDLPREIEPPVDLWPGIKGRIRRGTGEEGRGTSLHAPRWWIPLAAAAVLVLALGVRSWLRQGGAWEVERTAGVPRVDDAPLASRGTLRVGEWVETDDTSQAVIAVGTIGHVDVRPGSRVRLVRARDTDHRLALAYGAIHAKVDAPPRIFFVETPAGTAVDLGCEYTLETDRNGRGLIHVTGGYVELAWSGMRSVVPLGAYAVTRPGQGPGTPYLEDAPAALREALEAFDFEQGGADAARRALAAARAEDALSLWHLLTRVDATQRAEVYDRLAALVPPPPGVTRESAVVGDTTALERYWSLIRRIEFRRVILRGIRDIDPSTGLAR